MSRITRVVVPAFGGAERLQLRPATLASPGRRTVRVRVTHASVGATDALARRGGYLLQPRPGFTPGYDFVGVIDSSDADAAASGWERGARVAGCLPRMRSNSTLLNVSPSLLVAVPDALPSEVAGSLPLDLVTAALSASLAGSLPTTSVFVQGVSGAVGSLLAQHFTARGVTVLGTTSSRSQSFAEGLGVLTVDYRDPGWLDLLRSHQPEGVGASFDHTGNRRLREVTAKNGTIIRSAFVGRPGHERLDTVTGGLGSIARHFGSPRVRVCSVPLLVATQPKRYREMLTSGFEQVARGELRPPSVRLVPLAEVARAHRELAHLRPGEKIVLTMES